LSVVEEEPRTCQRERERERVREREREREKGEKRGDERFLHWLSQPPLLRSLARSLEAPGRFSEATGAGGIRVELDYTAKGYIYRARMYAEARTSPQRGRPCGFSLGATWRVDSRIQTRVGAAVSARTRPDSA
jgi:hypothetical protein